MSGSGGKADIELLDDGHKKGQHLPAFSVSIALLEAAPLLSELYTRYSADQQKKSSINRQI